MSAMKLSYIRYSWCQVLCDSLISLYIFFKSVFSASAPKIRVNIHTCDISKKALRIRGLLREEYTKVRLAELIVL